MITHTINESGSIEMTGMSGHWLSLLKYDFVYSKAALLAMAFSGESELVTDAIWGATDFSCTYDGAPLTISVPAYEGFSVVSIASGALAVTQVEIGGSLNIEGAPLAIRVDFSGLAGGGPTWDVLMPFAFSGIARKTALLALESALSVVQGDITGLTSDIADLLSTVGDHTLALSDQEVFNIDVGAAFDEADTRLGDLETAQTALEGQVTALSGLVTSLQGDLAALTDRVTTLEGFHP
jgi:hypothetical protein